MHHGLDIFNDPLFWLVLIAGILPIAVGAVMVLD